MPDTNESTIEKFWAHATDKQKDVLRNMLETSEKILQLKKKDERAF